MSKVVANLDCKVTLTFKKSNSQYRTLWWCQQEHWRWSPSVSLPHLPWRHQQPIFSASSLSPWLPWLVPLLPKEHLCYAPLLILHASLPFSRQWVEKLYYLVRVRCCSQHSIFLVGISLLLLFRSSIVLILFLISSKKNCCSLLWRGYMVTGRASWKSQWNRTSRSIDISAVLVNVSWSWHACWERSIVYDTCVNDEQNSSRQGGIVVYTDVENAWEDLDPQGVKF